MTTKVIMLMKSPTEVIMEGDHSYVMFHSVETRREGWHLRRYWISVEVTFIVWGRHRSLIGGRGQKSTNLRIMMPKVT